jgi:hypothetical protein
MPFRFRRVAFRSKKPSKEARKGTFEGRIVAGTRHKVLTSPDKKTGLWVVRDSQKQGGEKFPDCYE